ncbi:MAG TPA: DUF3306 domain-containing protein [Ramlibacter sp.]|uniref:DUF3306 domain-containing protein n=1 Tax=Ramlibacter sp. TaxID=1917967 RepID=UPI002D7EBECB|nr:DUF3306 domain-containing protein [Ramlibacter sp.]HET8748542.1 DUF3306 domain-containing protein [Ramlibacter sp.]
MSEGFLGRWSRRKEAVRKGEEVAPEAERPQPSPLPSPASGRGSLETAPGSLEAVPPSPSGGEGRGEGAAAPTPPPTLEDAQALTPASDFTRFAKPDVAPEVKNAAFKKLFSDPHFNVMDGLDVYIDDYGKPDPLPPEMLRKLASAKYLKLFDDEEEEQEEQEKKTKDPREVADQPEAGIVAQSGSPTAPASPPAEDHADPDLRLQQDDAPGPPGPGEESR